MTSLERREAQVCVPRDNGHWVGATLEVYVSCL